jgi:GT2 family glycosyltransferase
VKVSVIVSTYTKERYEEVRKCVESLKNQSVQPDEILLVLDPVDELIEFYKRKMDVKVVRSKGFGLSEARNKGVEEAKGDIIAFIDDDAWADKRWVENLLKNFEEEEVWIAGGKVIPVFDKKRPKWLAEELDWIVGCTYKGMPELKSEIRNPIGANMAFRREVFEVVGFFREEIGRYGKKLLGSEETELCLRLKRIRPDVKIIYDPSAIVYHRVPENRVKLSYALKRAYYEGYSKVILSRQYKLETEKSYTVILLKELFRKMTIGRFLECVGILLALFLTLLGWSWGRLNSPQNPSSKLNL